MADMQLWEKSEAYFVSIGLYEVLNSQKNSFLM